jgi:hypothetical protein
MATTKDTAIMSRLEVVQTNDTSFEGIKASNLEHVNTLGSVRLRHAGTNELVLVPQPSNDPNDPLNWQVMLALRSTRVCLSC